MQWWKEKVVYQIYPRSFQDSNGDGFGDIPGIILRLDKIKALGAGIIWLSPLYPSPDADNGYDISNYLGIDPKYGTMEDMENLIKEASKRDIRIIMDLVINHTSDEHEWFQKSRKRDPEYADYYIWRPAKPDGGKPNNWTGFFMEDAWTWDEKRGEYYLHLFHRKQPDLNYHNPKVIEEVKKILKFWLDKGIAGFRCDVINVLYKESLADGKPRLVVRGLEHYKTREGTHRILNELRTEVLEKYDCFTVGESAMVDLPEAKLLCDANRRELDMLFYFDHLEVDRCVAKYISKAFRAKKFLEIITKWQQGLEWNAIYLENHDQPRIVSHYGDGMGKYHARSAKMLSVLEFTLKGTPYVYQGQEIGMTNFDFTDLSQLNDVESLNIDKLMQKFKIPKNLRWKWIKESSRDNARTPVQWDATNNGGFSDEKPWLPVNSNYKKINYAIQEKDSESILNFYRKMIEFRAQSDILLEGEFTPLWANKKALAYKRTLKERSLTVILNFGRRPVKCPHEGEIKLSNIGRVRLNGTLAPYEAVII